MSIKFLVLGGGGYFGFGGGSADLIFMGARIFLISKPSFGHSAGSTKLVLKFQGVAIRGAQPSARLSGVLRGLCGALQGSAECSEGNDPILVTLGNCQLNWTGLIANYSESIPFEPFQDGHGHVALKQRRKNVHYHHRKKIFWRTFLASESSH